MSYDGECATLKFAAVSVADEGVYRCIAANELGEATTQMSFEVDPGETSEKDGVPPLFKIDKIKEKIQVHYSFDFFRSVYYHSNVKFSNYKQIFRQKTENRARCVLNSCKDPNR